MPIPADVTAGTKTQLCPVRGFARGNRRLRAGDHIASVKDVQFYRG
jgi:hypothetical protein